MKHTMEELRYREVINMRDGARLGFLGDIEFDFETGKIQAMIIPGRPKFFGLFGREEDRVIGWESIKKIGEDIVLVDINPDGRRYHRQATAQ